MLLRSIHISLHWTEKTDGTETFCQYHELFSFWGVTFTRLQLAWFCQKAAVCHYHLCISTMFTALESLKENYICLELLFFCFDLMVLEAIRAAWSHQLLVSREIINTALNSIKEY